MCLWTRYGYFSNALHNMRIFVGLADNASARMLFAPVRERSELPILSVIFDVSCLYAFASLRYNPTNPRGVFCGIGRKVGGASLAHELNRLTALKVEKVTRSGMYADGGGL